MEKYLLNSPQQPTDEEYSHAADMVMRHALQEFRKEKLRMEIDDSLANGQRERFMKLSEELINLLQ